MSLCKQTEQPNSIKEIKIDSESITESEAWSISDFEKLDRFLPLQIRNGVLADFHFVSWFQLLLSFVMTSRGWWYIRDGH